MATCYPHERINTYGQPCPYCEVASLRAELEEAKAQIEELAKDQSKHRELFEHVTHALWEFTGDIEWSDWQDKAEELGLLVSVPASEDFKAEWEADEMFVWAWSEAATDAAMKGEK